MITHHPPLELLMDYSTGAVSEPVALAVLTHLSMCDECRRSVDTYESIGGAALDSIEEEAVPEAILDAVLARLDDFEPAHTDQRPCFDDETVALVPEPLRRYLGRNLRELVWRRVGGMFEESRLGGFADGFKVALMRLKPGAIMPSHTHHGNEFTLVLAGGYSDGDKQFLPGDFDAKDASHSHRPVVDDDGECLCLVVLDAPLKLTGTLGRLVNPFLRL